MNKKELLNALNFVRPAVASKDVIESMTYFYFSGTNVVAYNDLISIQYPIKTDFIAFVKADDLYKVLTKLKTDEVAFKLEGDILKMKSNKAMTSFSTIYDKKVIERIDSVAASFKESKFKKLQKEFIEASKLCHSVASTNESNQTLTCMSVNGTDVVSTDNIRIAHFKMKNKMDSMLLKASEMKFMLPILPIEYMVTKSWCHFKNKEGCTFSIRLTKGEYPDMLKFGKFEGKKISLPKEVLDGIDLASVFTESSEEYITVTIKNNVLRIYKESEGGKVDFRTPIKYSGDDITFKINPELLKGMMVHSTDITIAERKAKLNSGTFTLVTSLFG